MCKTLNLVSSSVQSLIQRVGGVAIAILSWVALPLLFFLGLHFIVSNLKTYLSIMAKVGFLLKLH